MYVGAIGGVLGACQLRMPSRYASLVGCEGAMVSDVHVMRALSAGYGKNSSRTQSSMPFTLRVRKSLR